MATRQIGRVQPNRTNCAQCEAECIGVCFVLHGGVFECFMNLYVQCFVCNVLHGGVFECFINLYGRVLFPWLAPRAPFIAHRRATCAVFTAMSSHHHHLDIFKILINGTVTNRKHIKWFEIEPESGFTGRMRLMSSGIC